MKFLQQKFSRYAVLYLGLGLIATNVQGQAIISRTEIEARVKSDEARWQSRLPAQRPRLFFTPETWKALPARFAHATGREKQYFDDLLAYAHTLPAKAIPSYRTPEQLVSPHNALASAQAELWQRPIGDDMVVLALSLALEPNNTELRNRLHETVISVCNYPNWGIPTREIHLATSSLARGVAIAYDWHNDMWTDDEKRLIRSTIKKHVNDIVLGVQGQAHWAAEYRGNHNHVSMAGAGLCGVAFLNEIPDAKQWIGAAEVDFDRVKEFTSADGSTGEGVAYWSYSMAYILQYIEGTRFVTGSDSMYDSAFLKNCINYRLNSSTSGFGSILPWGDVSYIGYGPHHILYKLAAQYENPDGQYIANNLPFKVGNEGGAIAWTALWFDPGIPERPPVQLDYHARVLDVVTSRSGWGKNDYMLSVKSGFTSQSHSHLDIGALILGFGDEWLLTTPGYGTGKKEGEIFWERGKGGGRWTFLSNATESESTLLINGNNQLANADSKGTIDEFVSENNYCWTGVNMTKVYAGVNRVRREVLHCRGQYVLVFDEVNSSNDNTVQWLAQVPPSAVAVGDHLSATAKTGASLEIRSIWPQGTSFDPYTPVSKYNDLVPGRLKSYALKTRGRNVKYITALLPAIKGTKNHIKSITTKETDGKLIVTVQGEDWTDMISLIKDQAVVDRSAHGESRKMLTAARH